jgi:uncharacterized membrane protein YraQ (UPF0718 family)
MNLVVGGLTESWRLLVEAGPFLVAGFLLAGMMKVFLPIEAVRNHLGGGGFGSVVKASLLGVPLPLCSCSVLPTAVALRKRGADKSAVASFLISTPETGADSIALSYALLDPLMTLFRPVAAFATAIAAGGLELLFGRPAEGAPVTADLAVCDSGCCGDACDDGEAKKGIGDRLVDGVRYAFVDLMDDLAGWLLIGMLLAGGMMAILPDGFFTGLAGSDWVMMPLMLVVGAPIYVCATSSTPLAAALILKGVSPGAALVFLLAGPATNIGALMIIRRQLGNRSILLYLTAIFVVSIVMGMTLNGLYAWFDIDPVATVGAVVEPLPYWAEVGSAILFAAAAGWALAKQGVDLVRRYFVTPVPKNVA